MNWGKSIVTTIIDSGELEPFLEAGFNAEWLVSAEGGSTGVFVGEDRQAYQSILDHWQKHDTMMPRQVFDSSYPNFEWDEDVYSLSELIEVAVNEARRVMISSLVEDAVDLHDKGKISEAVDLLVLGGRHIKSVLNDSMHPAVDALKTKAEDIINVHRDPGAPLGIPDIDDSFYGFQPGQLITLMGRQKAGKSWLLLHSALEAWREGYSVLFFSIEMDADLLIERLVALGANVDPDKIYRGTLSKAAKADVIAFLNDEWHDPDPDVPGFYISRHGAGMTVDDVMADIERYKPHVVYIDGVYFMKDRLTAGHRDTNMAQVGENLAGELKVVAQQQNVSVVGTTQVQEKQHRNGDIEGRTIQGSTGWLKASDLVLGVNQNRDTQTITVNSVFSRRKDPPTVSFHWEFDDMTMVVENDDPHLNTGGL